MHRPERLLLPATPPLARRDGDDVGAAPAVAGGGGAPSNNDASAGDDGAPPPARRRVHNPYNTRSSSFKRRRGGSPSPPPRRCVARRDATHNAGSVWALFSIPGEDEQPAGPTFRRFDDIDADDAADAAPPDLPIRRSDAATLPRRGGGAMDPAATKYSILDRDAGTETFPFTPTANQKRIILECIASVWGIHSPRPFQVFAISAMVYLPSQFLYLIRKTGEGKSLVILTTATLLRGVTVVMVPLIGLGSDQVAKSFRLGGRTAVGMLKSVAPFFLWPLLLLPWK